jgi:hypothetical protein
MALIRTLARRAGPPTMSKTKLLISTSAILAVAAALAASPAGGDGSKATSAAVAALKSNLGNPPGLSVDEVRMTDDGIACIDYRVSDGEGKVPGHAVVQRDEVLRSSAGDRFQKAWDAHCLGPRGGMTSGE